MSRSFSSNLRGKVRNFPLPKNRPLVPLYEAIVNSINAIDERAQNNERFEGLIEIEVVREKTIFSDSDSNTVRGFSIIDNGIGFNDQNMASFMEADSEYKMAIGGKGVGRFSWLKAFNSARITSTYKDNGSFVTRSFVFSLDNSEIEDSLEDAPEAKDYQTIIELSDYKKEYKSEVPKQLSTIAIRIIQHCFVYFLNSNCPEIQIFDTDESISLNQMFNHRISKGRDCPYCAHNPLVLKGVNDLETLRPDLLKEWDYEKNTVLPSEVTIKSNKTVWWKCFKGHEWRSKIEHRANGSSCPYCAKGAQTSFPEQAIYYYVKKAYPDAIHKYKDLFIKKGMELDVYIPSLQTGIEYDGEAYHNNPRQMRNDKEKSEICAKNNIRLIRLKEDPSVESANTDIIISAALGIDNALQQLSNIVPGLSSIDVNKDADEIRQGYLSSLEEKSLLAINPELCNEWSYEKNKTTPDMYLPNSNAKVWWVCSQGHEWQAYIYTRNAGSGCPYCLNRIIRKGYNDLATKRPDLMKEWHPTKNNGLDPYQLSPGSGKKAWWICEKGHEWRAEISSRNKGAGCPECFDIRRRAGLNKKNVND